MSRGLVPPSGDRENELLKRRITDLERKLNRNRDGVGDQGKTFTLAGSIYVKESPQWTPRTTVELVRIVVLLKTPGTTSTTVVVYKNGVALRTIVVAANDDSNSTSLSTTIVPDNDKMTVGITVAGTGAADLSVSLQYI